MAVARSTSVAGEGLWKQGRLEARLAGLISDAGGWMSG